MTRRGKPIAVVVSLSEYARLSNARVPFSAAYAKFLDTHSLPAVGLDDGFFKSIRETDVGRKIVL